MPVIAMQGMRGGVGATSVTVALAWTLCQLGESVLVIDFSPDNLLRLHFNTPFSQTRGWARSLRDGDPWQQGAMRYYDRLDFLPFGQLTVSERLYVQHYCREKPTFWQDNLITLQASEPQRWILLDLPTGEEELVQQAATAADSTLLLLNPDANCHARLHQQSQPSHCHFLINNFSSFSQLQQDLYQLWQQTLSGLVPVVIHHDEALAEALAMKQPLGEYRPESLAADEVLTLANWCLLNLSVPTTSAQTVESVE